MGGKWCAAMRLSDGGWQTVSCDYNMTFVCSGPPGPLFSNVERFWIKIKDNIIIFRNLGNPGNVTSNPPTTTQLRFFIN